MAIDTTRLEPATDERGHGHARASFDAAEESSARPSPFMQSSLPTIAASYDQYVRQFYDRFQVPQQRIFPAGIAE